MISRVPGVPQLWLLCILSCFPALVECGSLAPAPAGALLPRVSGIVTLCSPAQAQQNLQWYMLLLCTAQPETRMGCHSVERNKGNIFGLNSIAKTVKGQAIVRESMKGVSAPHILLRKDDVFIQQSDIKDM